MRETVKFETHRDTELHEFHTELHEFHTGLFRFHTNLCEICVDFRSHRICVKWLTQKVSKIL
jgi:hypothetical protein